MRVIARLLHYLLRHKGRLCLAFMLALVGVAFELARPWPVKIVIDSALGSAPLPSVLSAAARFLPGAETRGGLVAWCVAVALVITLGGALLSFVVLNMVIAVAQRLVCDLSLDLFRKLQRLSISFHEKHEVGDLLQRMSQDVFSAHFVVSQVALPGTMAILCLIGMFAIMASLDLTLALIAISVVPLLAAALALFAKPMDATTTRQYQVQGHLMSLVEQSLFAIRAIQGFGREEYIQQKLEKRAYELADAYRVAIRVSGSYKEIINAVTGAASALLLGVGAWRVMRGRLSVGDLWIFLGYLAALYGPVSNLSMSVGYAIQVVARGRRVFEVMDSQEEIPEQPHARALTQVRGEVVFENVTFGYASPGSESTARPVLRNLSFHVRPGQIIAVVGATGAGKTTLVSLLPRFHDPWQGRILLDGNDLRDLSLKSLRENISLVLQDPFLFSMSVAENIAFGRPGAMHEEVVAAAQAARAHEFILRMPQGYDTVIAEKGISLSGGERQRISIARALIKPAPILILDEPTSSLDAKTESNIFNALSEVMRNRTTFIISHRLTTIQRADMVIVLKDGGITEQGTHESLMKQGQIYAQLFKHQYARFPGSSVAVKEQV